MTGTTTGRNRELAGLCLGVFFFFCVINMQTPLVAWLARGFGATEGELGLLIGLPMVGPLLLAVAAGFVVERLGTRRPLIIAALLAGLACISVLFVDSFTGLLVAMIVFRLADLFIILGAQAHVSTLGPGRSTEKDFGWYGTAAAAGQLVGPLLGGFISEHFGVKTAWMATGAFGLATALSFLALIGPGHIRHPDAPHQTWTLARFRNLLNLTTVMAILTSFVVIFADGARNNFFPVYLTENLGMTKTLAGFVISMRAVASICSRFFLGWFVTTLGGRMRALITSLSVLSVGILVTPLCTDWVTLTLNTWVVGLAVGLAQPLSMAIVADQVAPPDRGVATGLRLTGNRLAQTSNPILYGFVIQGFGMNTAFVAGGTLLLLMLIPMALWAQKERKETDAIP